MKYNKKDIALIHKFSDQLLMELEDGYGWLYSFTSDIQLLDEEIDDQGRYIYRAVIINIEGIQEHDPRLNIGVSFCSKIESELSDGYEELTLDQLIDELQVQESFMGEFVDIVDPVSDFWFHGMNYIINNL